MTNSYNSTIKLGYYNHGHFIKNDLGELLVPFDIAIWIEQFSKYNCHIYCFLNELKLKQGATMPKSHVKVNQPFTLINLGPQQSHLRKMLGIGLNKNLLKKTCDEIDCIIIQGPTGQQNIIAKYAYNRCKIITLLVGIWKPWPKEMFKVFPLYREVLINIFKLYNRFQTTRLINVYSDIFMGNNLQMPVYYKSKKTFLLVSKGLVRQDEILDRQIDTRNKKHFNIAFYSRLDPEKAVEILINATKLLKDKSMDIRLNIYGSSSTSNYQKYLEKQIKDLRLNDSVILHGELKHSEKSDHLKNNDLYIFNTCTTEGFPRSIWEAMAVGLPVISCSYLGAESFLKDGENCLLYEQNNLASLVKKLEYVFENPDVLNNIQIEAYKLLKEHTLETSTVNIYNIIAEKIKSKNENYSIN